MGATTHSAYACLALAPRSMAAPDSHSQCFLFEGPEQPAVQLMAPQTLLHWPGTGSFGEASAPAALAPARLQQVQHAQHMPPLGQQSMHGGQYDAAYPLPAQGVQPQAPSQQLQALPAQLHHAPQLLALQPQQGSAAGAIYVNQRQLASILRRRAKRQKQEAENRLPRVRQVGFSSCRRDACRSAHADRRPSLPACTSPNHAASFCPRRPAVVCEQGRSPARQEPAAGREGQVPEVWGRQRPAATACNRPQPAVHDALRAACRPTVATAAPAPGRSKEEIEAQERLESGLADLVDARLEQEAPLQQLQQERQPSDGGVDDAPLPALAGARPCTLSACGVRRTRS